MLSNTEPKRKVKILYQHYENKIKYYTVFVLNMRLCAKPREWSFVITDSFRSKTLDIFSLDLVTMKLNKKLIDRQIKSLLEIVLR